MKRIRKQNKTTETKQIKKIKVIPLVEVPDKVPLKLSKNPCAFYCNNALFDNWKIHVHPILNAMCSATCVTECAKSAWPLEPLMIEKHCIPNPSPAVFGCFKHGRFVHLGVNNDRVKLYRTQFTADILSRKDSVDRKNKCTCQLVWLPRYYQDLPSLSWHAKSVYYCKDHLTLHYCLQSPYNCNNCFCCVIAKTPCPFRCHFIYHGAKGSGEGTCIISGCRIDNRQELHVELTDKANHQVEAAKVESVKSNTDVLLQKAFKEWIIHAKATEYQVPITITTFFNLFMNEFCYAGNIMTRHKKLFFKIGIPLWIRFLTEYSKINLMTVEWPLNAEEELMALWRILTLYMPYFSTMHSLYSMISHLSIENGLYLADFGLIPLHASFVPCLRHLNICKPVALKKVNLSQYVFDFCEHLNNLDKSQQQDLLRALTDKQLSLLVLREDHCYSKN